MGITFSHSCPDTIFAVGEDSQNFTTTEQVINFASAHHGQEISFFVEGKDKEYKLSAKEYKASYVVYFDSEKIYEFSSDYGKNPVATERENTEYTDIEKEDDKTAYIKLNQFEGNAGSEMESTLKYMRSRGRTRLILDLRYNGGGSMSVLTDIAADFIDNGGKKKSVVAYAINSKGEKQTYSTSSNQYNGFLTSVAVIANENTASASECLIGALSCYGVLGENPEQKIVLIKNSSGDVKTYGKGIMQTTFIMRNGGALKLTTAKIYWPDAKTCIHAKGITSGVVSTDDIAVKRAVELLNQP